MTTMAALDEEEKALIAAFRAQRKAKEATGAQEEKPAAKPAGSFSGEGEDASPQDAFVHLCEKGNLAAVKEFLAAHPSLDIDASASDGFTGLITAVKHGHAALATALVTDFHATISLPVGKCEHTALRAAAITGNREILLFLLYTYMHKQPVDVNQRSQPKSKTPLQGLGTLHKTASRPLYSI